MVLKRKNIHDIYINVDRNISFIYIDENMVGP
jgi:hypothetical protein